MLPLHLTDVLQGNDASTQTGFVDLSAQLPEGGNLFCWFTLRAVTAGTGAVRATAVFKGPGGLQYVGPQASIDLADGRVSSVAFPIFKSPAGDGQELVLLLDRDPEGEGGSWTVDLDVR